MNLWEIRSRKRDTQPSRAEFLACSHLKRARGFRGTFRGTRISSTRLHTSVIRSSRSGVACRRTLTGYEIVILFLGRGREAGGGPGRCNGPRAARGSALVTHTWPRRHYLLRSRRQRPEPSRPHYRCRGSLTRPRERKTAAWRTRWSIRCHTRRRRRLLVRPFIHY